MQVLVRREVLEQILMITKAMEKCLESEEAEEYAKLIDDRENAIKQLEAFKDVPLAAEDRDKIYEILTLDERMKTECTRQMEESREKIRQLRVMKNRDDYYNNPYTIYNEEGVFFDKRRR